MKPKSPVINNRTRYIFYLMQYTLVYFVKFLYSHSIAEPNCINVTLLLKAVLTFTIIIVLSYLTVWLCFFFLSFHLKLKLKFVSISVFVNIKIVYLLTDRKALLVSPKKITWIDTKIRYKLYRHLGLGIPFYVIHCAQHIYRYNKNYSVQWKLCLWDQRSKLYYTAMWYIFCN